MIKFPQELIECTFLNEDGDRQLKENATKEQKEIFEKFYKSLNVKESNDEFMIED